MYKKRYWIENAEYVHNVLTFIIFRWHWSNASD